MAMQISGPILTADQTRLAEAAAMSEGISVETLMDRAGAAVAEAVWRFGGGRPTLILCGPGNNGGDGYVAATLLKKRGCDVHVAALRDPRTPAAIKARAQWSGPVETLANAIPGPVLVDALFGTGLKKPLELEVKSQLQRLADAARLVVAVDVPSGVDADTGADLGAVNAHVTIALVSIKPAHVLYPAAGFCGHINIDQLGIAAHSDVAILERPKLPAPGPADHKYTRGMVVVVEGDMDGAALLSAGAAQRSGAGYVVLTGQNGAAAHSVVRKPFSESLSDARAGAIVIGPGLGRDEAAQAKLLAVIETGKRLVLDADALALVNMGQLCAVGPRTILTPHEGEFARLFGALAGSKIDRARAAATASNCVVILKGADTVIASPDGRTCVSPLASHWLASAGTGDVLAGIVGAMLARDILCFEAACAAVWLHGASARLFGPGFIADDLLAHLPAALIACA